MIRISIFILLVCANPARADDLVSVYQLVNSTDPQLKAAEAGHRAVLTSNDKTRALLLPTASISANTSKNKLDSSISNPPKSQFDNSAYNLSISQPVFHYNAFILRKQANINIRESSASLAATQQEVILKTAERYFDLLSSHANLEFAQSEKKAIAKQLEQAKKRFDVGLIAITDVHEARSAYDLAIASEITAINQLDSAGEALSEITGRTHHRLAKLINDLPLHKPDPENMADWVDIATRQNLELQALKLKAKVSQEEIKLQRAGHYPTLDLVANHKFSDTGGDFGRRSTTNSIALQLNVPLYQGGLITAQTREAAHRYSQAIFNLEQQRRTILRKTRDAYRGVINGISQVKALKQANISSKSALETTQAGFDVGTRTIVDVLLAQRTLFRSIRDYDQARHQYIVNMLRLKLSAGTLSPDDLKYFNQWLTK
ncbi:MAG: TolC family outer membrane protein [Gammaproteobacteria bacterium]|nr:TolC family outer membrane protein [Gammaproteobacteria bacterium]